MVNCRVVIVEDELIAAEFLKEMLEEHGVEVLDIIDSGERAIEMCPKLKPDVIFMDVMLSDHISGSEAAIAISRKCESRIIFLTAHTDNEMTDYAVESKAVNYLTKPYNETEIIRALRLATVNRSPDSSDTKKHQAVPEKLYLVKEYIYHTKQKRLTQHGQEIPLGSTGQKLVELLCSHPGISISNEQISMDVWSELVNDRTLRSLIHRVRTATDDELIINVSKTGYKIMPADGSR